MREDDPYSPDAPQEETPRVSWDYKANLPIEEINDLLAPFGCCLVDHTADDLFSVSVHEVK